MKRILILMVVVMALRALGADVEFPLVDLTSGPTTNRRVLIQPVELQGAANKLPLLDVAPRTSDAEGRCWVSNMVAGLYSVTVQGPPSTTRYQILVPETNGVLNARALLVGSTNVPGVGVAYTAAASDARYPLRSEVNTGEGISLAQATAAAAAVVETNTTVVTASLQGEINSASNAVFSLLKNSASFNLAATNYAVQGREANIYWDNIVRSTVPARDLFWDASCNQGYQREAGWRIVPTNTYVSNYSLTISVGDGTNTLATHSGTLHVSPLTAGAEVTRKVLLIGDSTTADGEVVTELNRISGLDLFKISTIGTLGTSTNKHEGRYGWQWHQVGTQSTSPFYSSGSFSMSTYLANSGLSLGAGDWVIFNLGINDIMLLYTDAEVEAKISTVLNVYSNFFANITNTVPGVRVGVCIPIPPASSQSAFGAMYNSGWARDRHKRNISMLSEALAAYPLGFKIPINAALDTVNGFPTSTNAVSARNLTAEVSLRDSVHPAYQGYMQIADAIWAFLKGQETAPSNSTYAVYSATAPAITPAITTTNITLYGNVLDGKRPGDQFRSGIYAGQYGTNSRWGVFIGSYAGQYAGNAQSANFIGPNAGMHAAIMAVGANIFGGNAGQFASNILGATMIGYEAGRYATHVDGATFIGRQSGMYATNATNSIFIGPHSGTNRADTIWIDTRATTDTGTYVPLIYGECDNRMLKIGGGIVASNFYGNGAGLTNILLAGVQYGTANGTNWASISTNIITDLRQEIADTIDAARLPPATTNAIWGGINLSNPALNAIYMLSITTNTTLGNFGNMHASEFRTAQLWVQNTAGSNCTVSLPDGTRCPDGTTLYCTNGGVRVISIGGLLNFTNAISRALP